MSIKRTGKSIADQLRDAKAVFRDLPGFVGTEAVRFFKGSFKRQGWIDDGPVKRWKPRNKKAKRNKGRAILVDTARLKRSIRIVQKGQGYVVIGTDVPYAQIHNEGGTINKSTSIKAHKRKIKKAFGKKLKQMKVVNVKSFTRKMKLTMPQRQFLGKSLFFERRIEMQLTQKMKVALGAI